MNKQINPTIKAHLIRGGFYLLLLIAVSAIPFALAQRNATNRGVRNPASNSNLPFSQFNADSRLLPYDVRLARTTRFPQISGTRAGHVLPVLPPPKAPQGILYDQYNNAATTVTLSAAFTGDLSNSSADLADDFVVPAGETWNVESIDADGAYFECPNKVCPGATDWRARRRLHLVEREIAAPVGDVREHRIVQENRLLRHDAHERPQARAGESRERNAAHRDHAAGRLVEAGQQVHQRGLPGPGRTHDRRHLTAPHLQVHAVQHGRLSVVGERDAAVFDAPLEARGHFARPVPFLPGEAENLEHATGGRGPAGHGRGVVGHRLDRGHEAQRHRDERDQHLGPQHGGLAQRESRPDGEDQHDDRPGEHLTHRAREQGVALRAQHALAVAVRERAKPIGLEPLRDVGPHQLDRGHELAHQAGELTALVRLLARAAAHLPDHGPHDEHQQRRAHQGHEGETPREADEDREIDDDEADILQQRRERGGDRRLHLVRVVDHPGEQLPPARAL